MKKQKTKLLVLILANFIIGITFAGQASANGSATISWIAPTDTDLAGFRIYYKNSAFDCIAWNAADQAARKADNAALAAATPVVDDAKLNHSTTLKYVFTDVARLTPGGTFYFAVVAYDTSGNLSDCSTGSGTVAASKAVSYPADITTGTANASLHRVDGADFSLLHTNYSTGVTQVGNVADITGNDIVDGADFSLLHAEYNMFF